MLFWPHNHDRLYASKSHKHDDRYSLLGHTHDTLYSLLGHTHDTLYSLLGHTHDTLYSLLGHTHDTLYSLLGHTHSRIVGEITIWPTDTAPTGWLLCYGQTVLRSTALGTLLVNAGCPFGTGDGSTTVNLPDFRGRMPLGQDDMGGSSANRVTSAQADLVGGNGGEEKHTLTVTEIAAHRHEIDKGAVNYLSSGSSFGWPGWVGSDIGAYTNYSGDNTPHNNMPPWLTINFIIYSG